jgi:hypothetical protein
MLGGRPEDVSASREQAEAIATEEESRGMGAGGC